MDKRVYEIATGRFGNIIKTTGVLGLKNCMTVVFDDGTKGAFFGGRCNEIICVEDAEIDLPLDVVAVWKRELKEGQATTLVKDYLALDADGREDARKRWAATTKRSRSKFKI